MRGKASVTARAAAASGRTNNLARNRWLISRRRDRTRRHRCGNHHSGNRYASGRRRGRATEYGRRLSGLTPLNGNHAGTAHLRRRERVEDRRTRRLWHLDVRGGPVVWIIVRRGRRRRRELRLLEHRPRRGGRYRWSRRGGGRHDDDPIEDGEVRDRCLSRGGHVAAHRPQEHVERLPFGNVVQFDRERAAGNSIAVDHLRLTDACPLRENLSHGRVLCDDRHASVLQLQLDIR